MYVYADESGNFDFSRASGASRYFAVGTVVLRDQEPAAISADILELRRDLVWRGHDVDAAFHATRDKQVVRDQVFAVLAQHHFRVDATLLEKSKALPRIRSTDEQFYKYAWFYHFKHLAQRVLTRGDELMVVAATLGTGRKRRAFRASVQDVVRQCGPYAHRVAFWPAESDPCVQVADYCLWAVMRQWNQGDSRSVALLWPKVQSEYDLWKLGKSHYY